MPRGDEQTPNALLQAGEIALKRTFSTFCWIGVACGLQPAVEFALNEAGILEQLDDLGSHDPIEKILADWVAGAKRSAAPAPRVGTGTTIVMDRASARSRRCPVERIAAVGTGYQALHHAGHDCTARCVRLVGGQTLLGKGKGLLIDDRRHRNGDPIVLWPLMVCAVARGDAAAPAQRSGDAVPWCRGTVCVVPKPAAPLPAAPL